MAESTERITADLIEQTPIEKCSLNPRRGRNSRRLLTGFIIYASEVRKEVVEKYPDQNFGFISKLVGDKWRALDTDARFKYHQRALIHNKRIKELAAREGVSLGDIDLANGSVITTPKPTKNKAKKLKEGKRRINDSRSQTPNFDSSSSSMPETPNGKKVNGFGNISYSNDMSATPGGAVTPAASKTFITRHPEDHQYVQNTHSRSKKVNTMDSATQTPQIRFIEPPPKKTLRFSDAFLKNLPELIRNVQTARAQMVG